MEKVEDSVLTVKSVDFVVSTLNCTVVVTDNSVVTTVVCTVCTVNSVVIA